MQEGGWIKIHRKIREWQHYGEPSVLVVFIDLLLSAKTESGWVHGVKVERGQVLTSVARIMDNTGLGSDNTVRKALKKLVESGEIYKKSTNSYTLITINQFDKYQCYANNAEQYAERGAQQGAEQTAERGAHIKEYKNIENNVVDVRAHERKPISEYMEQIRYEQIWAETICMNFKLSSIDEFQTKVDEFIQECKCQGYETEDSEKDAKAHFSNWLRIRKNAERKEKKNGNNDNNRATEDPRERIARILRGDIRS